LISIPLLPVLDLKQLNEEYMVWDRYLYLPAMGFCYLVALCFVSLQTVFKRLNKVWSRSSPGPVSIVPALLIAILLVLLTVATSRENRAWADSYSLWSKAAAVRPGFWAAHYNVGLTLLDQHWYEGALISLRRAAQLNPREPCVFDASGRAYRALEDREHAIASFERALQLDHTFFESLNNLGTVYFDSADYTKAEKCFRAALEVKPGALNARYNLALVYVREGRYPESISEFEFLVGVSPDDADTCYELGLAYAATGRADDARATLRRSLSLARSRQALDKVSEALERLQ